MLISIMVSLRNVAGPAGPLRNSPDSCVGALRERQEGCDPQNRHYAAPVFFMAWSFLR